MEKLAIDILLDILEMVIFSRKISFGIEITYHRKSLNSLLLVSKKWNYFTKLKLFTLIKRNQINFGIFNSKIDSGASLIINELNAILFQNRPDQTKIQANSQTNSQAKNKVIYISTIKYSYVSMDLLKSVATFFSWNYESYEKNVQTSPKIIRRVQCLKVEVKFFALMQLFCGNRNNSNFFDIVI